MNFTTLRYFMDIADCGSITQAAERHFITQQAMSKQLRALESEYGAELVLRTVPLRLTPAGKIVYDAASRMLAIQDGAVQRLAALGGGAVTLTIGLMYTDMPPFLSPLIARYYENGHSGVKIRFVQDCLNVSREEPDIVFSLEWPRMGYTAFPLIRDELAAVVSRALLQRSFGAGCGDIIRRLTQEHDLTPLYGLPLAHPAMPDGEFDLSMFVGEHMETVTGDVSFSLCRAGRAVIVCTGDYTRSKMLPGDEQQLLILPMPQNASIPHLSVYCRSDRLAEPAAAAFVETARAWFGEKR